MIKKFYKLKLVIIKNENEYKIKYIINKKNRGIIDYFIKYIKKIVKRL